MQDLKKSSSINHLLVLSGLWFINMLIVIFGLPFLIYTKLQEICSDNSNKLRQEPKTKPKSTAYLPQQIDSKL